VKPMHGRFRTILTGDVEPGTPGGKDIQDAVEQSTLISTRSPDMWRGRREMRLNDLPQCIVHLMKTHEGRYRPKGILILGQPL